MKKKQEREKKPQPEAPVREVRERDLERVIGGSIDIGGQSAGW